MNLFNEFQQMAFGDLIILLVQKVPLLVRLVPASGGKVSPRALPCQKSKCFKNILVYNI